MDDRWWIERGRVGCDEAVGDGKSERCFDTGGIRIGYVLRSASMLVSVSASLRRTSLHFPCSMHGSGLSFWWECFLTGFFSNRSIASFIKSWNSLMNSIQSSLWLTSDKLSSSSSFSWSLAWSVGDSFATSCCRTLPVLLLDSPVTSHLSGDRCHRTCSCVFSGISSIILFSITVSVMSWRFCVSGVFPVGFPTASFPIGLPTVSLSPSDAEDSSSAFYNFQSCFCVLVYTLSYCSYDSSGTLL